MRRETRDADSAAIPRRRVRLRCSMTRPTATGFSSRLEPACARPVSRAALELAPECAQLRRMWRIEGAERTAHRVAERGPSVTRSVDDGRQPLRSDGLWKGEEAREPLGHVSGVLAQLRFFKHEETVRGEEAEPMAQLRRIEASAEHTLVPEGGNQTSSE